MFSVSRATKKYALKPVTSILLLPKTLYVPTDSLSYAMGVQTAEYYKTQGIENNESTWLRRAVIVCGKVLKYFRKNNVTWQYKLLQEFMIEKRALKRSGAENFLENKKRSPGNNTPSGCNMK